jgi:PAS domain S-box-containing protein
VELSPDGIFVIRDGLVAFANPAFLRMAGTARAEDVLGRPVLDFVHEDSRPRAIEMMQRLVEAARPEPLFEERLQRLDGTLLDVEIAAMPFEEDGARCVEVVIRDATARRRQEQESRRAQEELERRVAERTAAVLTSDRRTHAIVETALDAVISIDGRGIVTGWNPRATDLFGWSPTEAIGRPLLELAVPAHLQGVAREALALHARDARTSFGARFETPALDRSGREFAAEVSVVRVDAADGPAFTAFVRDIEDRRRAEGAIRDSERRLRQIIDLVPHFIFAKDEDGRFLLANRAVADIYGTTVDQLIGRTDGDFVRISSEVERFRRHDLEVTQGGNERLVVEERVTDPTGVEHLVRTIKIPFVFSGTAARAVLGVATDVTDQALTEQRIHDERRRLRQIIDLVPHFIFAKDLDGRFLLVNKAVADAYGTTVEQLLGRRDADFAKSEAEVARFRADDLEVMRGARPKVIPEETITDAQGRERVLQTVKIPFTFSGTGSPAVLGVSTDVTERKRTEERLLQAQKMEGLGRLAGGIAHDFNNLLTAILGYAQLLGADAGDAEAVRRDVDAIRGAADRAAALTRQLLTFARRQRTEPRVVDLYDLALDLDKLLRRVLGADIELVTVVGDGEAPVEADPGQLEQVLVNLAVNARDAMPRGGRIALTIRELAESQVPAEAKGQVKPGPAIEIAVEDAGTGMSREVLARVFEPFFTTKGPGVGTGLGLATSYGIVKQFGGHIWGESEPGHGSTFRVVFPRSEKPAVRRRADEERPAPRGGETVLVVDDDGIVLDVSVRALAASGYKVLVAATATAALALSDTHPGPIDLLVADVVMPGLSGPEVAERMLARRPGTRVLYVSGFHETPPPVPGTQTGTGEVLAKPFTPASLARKVREVLDRRP